MWISGGSLLHALLPGSIGSFSLDSWNLFFHLSDGKEEQESHVELMGRSGRLSMSFLLLLCGPEFCHVASCDSKIKLVTPYKYMSGKEENIGIGEN